MADWARFNSPSTLGHAHAEDDHNEHGHPHEVALAPAVVAEEKTNA
jgi:hypothetical protein